jgi:hypothetical protein
MVVLRGSEHDYWGKIEETRSSVLLVFAYSQNAVKRVFFQVSLPSISPLSDTVGEPRFPGNVSPPVSHSSEEKEM